MFKRFDKDEISSNSQVKSSVQRSVRAKVIEQVRAPLIDLVSLRAGLLTLCLCTFFSQFPWIEEYIDEILPKKR
jgi:hypothetical protein